MSRFSKNVLAIFAFLGLLVGLAGPASAAAPTPGGNITSNGIIKSYTCSVLQNPTGYCKITLFGNDLKPQVHYTARIWGCSKYYNTPEGTYVNGNGSGLKYLVNAPYVSILWGVNRVGSIGCFNP